MNVNVDHIYDLIQIEDKIIEILEVFNPQFSSVKNEIQGIIISKLYPLRAYNCWEHQMGIYHLVNLCDVNKSLDTKIVSKNLKLAALLHNIGHTEYGYQLEELLMYSEKKDGNKYLENRYLNVKKFIHCSDNCEHKCFETAFENDDFQMLKSLESAKYILGKKSEFEEFKSTNKKRYEGFQINDVIKYLICKKENGYKMLKFLDRIDFVLRDLYYLGVFDVQINFQYLLNKNREKLITDIPELQVVNKDLYNYLLDNIYFDEKVLFVTRIMQKEIIKNNLVNIEALDDSKSLRELFEIQVNIDTLYDKIDDFYLVESYQWRQNKGDNLIIEEKCIPDNWDISKYHEEKGVMISVYSNKRLFNANIYLSKTLDKFSNVIECLLCMKNNISDFSYNEKQFNSKLLSILFEEKIEYNCEKFENILDICIENYCNEIGESELIELYGELLLNSTKKMFGDTEDEEDSIFSREFMDIIYRDNLKGFKKSLGQKKFSEMKSIKDTMFFSSNDFLEIESGNVFLDFVIEQLKLNIVDEESDSREDSLEFLVFLLEVKRLSAEKNKYSCVIPSFSLGNKKEFDCMTLLYSDAGVEMNIIEVSLTNKDGKTINDLQKNQEVVNKISKKYTDISIIKKIVAPELKVCLESVEDILQS